MLEGPSETPQCHPGSVEVSKPLNQRSHIQLPRSHVLRLLILLAVQKKTSSRFQLFKCWDFGCVESIFKRPGWLQAKFCGTKQPNPAHHWFECSIFVQLFNDYRSYLSPHFSSLRTGWSLKAVEMSGTDMESLRKLRATTLPVKSCHVSTKASLDIPRM